MGPSMYDCFNESIEGKLTQHMFSSNTLSSVKRTGSLDNLFMFRESEKNLKMTPMLSFFVMLVLRDQKRDKLSLERRPFKPFNEWERKQDHLTIFSCLESLKRA
jgi:hypothetical protein